VRRAADDQLRNVVENMGRPGYVLVARQMGKTNLLLNAKRELSIDGDLFLYVDLSNKFPTLQQFFRNIVDTALDAHPEHFEVVRERIEEARSKNTGLPAHKEHEQELRFLLRAIPGKLVICMDEIDALTRSPYSDSVFSLIRSTYFASRINFAEFNRLTYILSGVAEPTELIKNKDISPFNIGEKIYLDDFTYEEYLVFLRKADLDLTQAVNERIFYWTNGNPRMCWDLCSAIEDKIIERIEMTVEVVDQIVRKLYLTSYDLAPVDHIRQLVEDDKEIRNAVMNIHYGKSSVISDLQRTKLYLAGVVKANFLSGDIAIKNKIIEESLREDWISSIESSKLSNFQRADKKLTEHDYQSALMLYQSCEAEVPETEKTFLYHSMGECCIQLEDYEGAIDYLTRAPAKKSSFAMLFYRQQLWIGIAHFRVGNVDESISSLNSIINSNFDDGFPDEYYEALINRLAPYFERFDKYGEEIIQDCDRLITLLDVEPAIGVELGNTLRCAAYLNMAIALQKFSREDEAARILRRAIGRVPVTSKPTLIVQLLDISSTAERLELLNFAEGLISQSDIYFKKDVLHEQFNFNENVYANLLVRSLEYGSVDVWSSLLVPLLDGRFGESSAVNVLNLTLLLAINRGKRPIVKHIFRAILALPNHDIGEEELKVLFYYVLIVDGGGEVDDIEEAYVRYLPNWNADSLTERDLLIAYVLAEKYINLKRFDLAETVLSLAQEKCKQVSSAEAVRRMQSAYFAIDFMDFILLKNNATNQVLKERAHLLRARVPSNVEASPIFASNFFTNVVAELDKVLKTTLNVVQKRNATKHGRNDFVKVKYSDGTMREGKYKRFEMDVLAGLCIVTNEDSLF